MIFGWWSIILFARRSFLAYASIYASSFMISTYEIHFWFCFAWKFQSDSKEIIWDIFFHCFTIGCDQKSFKKQRYGSKRNFYFLFSKILTRYVFTSDFLRQLFQNRFFKIPFFKTEYLIFQILLKTQNSIVSKKIITQPAITCSKLTIETLEQVYDKDTIKIWIMLV